MKGQKNKMTWFKKGRWTIKKTVAPKKTWTKFALNFGRNMQAKDRAGQVLRT